jgi:hypothetical protein
MYLSGNMATGMNSEGKPRRNIGQTGEIQVASPGMKDPQHHIMEEEAEARSGDLREGEVKYLYP